MMKKLTGKFYILFLTVLLSVSSLTTAVPGLSIEAFAAVSDYKITSADWEYRDDGRVYAIWDETNEKTSYGLYVFKGSAVLSNRLYKSVITASANSHDFSLTIARHGTGTYYFTVYPKKGGTGMTVTSGSFEVDSDMLNNIRTAINYKALSGSGSSSKTIQYDLPLGWVQLPDGTWKYQLEKNKFARNQFLKVDGKWYYFGADSVMLTGMQQINKMYYYFNADGSMWTTENRGTGLATASGTVIGSSVNTSSTSLSGIAGTSVPVSAAGTDTSTGSTASGVATYVPYNSQTSLISGVNISFEELDSEPGKVLPLEISAPSNVQLSEIHYNIPEAAWTAGYSVTVTMKVSPVGNYQFGNNTTFRSGNAVYKSQTGDAFTRVVKFEYVPKLKLSVPQKLYLDGANVLHWNKVTNAGRYSIKVSYKEESDISETNPYGLNLFIEDSENSTEYNSRTKTFTVSTNEFAAADYINGDEIDNVKFEVYAMASNNNTDHYLNSDPAVFTAAQAQTESQSDVGNLTSNKGTLMYLDSGGSGISGWQLINGAWYYFDNKGQAAGAGWQRIDRKWYFFSADSTMKVGWIEVDGCRYYLDESENDNYGAMVTGTVNIGGADYTFNAGERADLPTGALIE
ncbi:MAG: hypothetical protein Q4E57_01790 [Eubacteriales bacterium]|nr:hypothetical protein [Eubacteriales bacterium]